MTVHLGHRPGVDPGDGAPEGSPGDGAPEGSPGPGDAQALIEEARSRRRRRRRVGLAVTLVAVVVAALVWTAVSRARQSPGTVGGAGVGVATQSFPGPFVPSQVVTAGGRAWVLGSTRTGPAAHCSLDAADPGAAQATSIALPACGGYVAADGGEVFIAASYPRAGTITTAVRLEVVDTATGRVSVKAPVVTTQLGSALGHMDLAYGAGSVWLWAAVPDVVLRISPVTGAVVQTVTGLPPSADGHASISVGAGGLWLAPGAGMPAAVYRAVPDTAGMEPVWRGSPGQSVVWLSAVGQRVWANVVGPARHGTITSSTLVAFDRAGRVVAHRTAPLLDAPFVTASGRLWSVGSGGSCNGPQRLWSADPATGALHAVGTLRTTVAACLTERPDGSRLASAGGDVFVLEPTGAVDPPALLHLVRSGPG